MNQIDSIVLDDAKNGIVRVVKMEDRWYFCVHDVIMVICEKDRNQCGEILYALFSR